MNYAACLEMLERRILLAGADELVGQILQSTPRSVVQLMDLAAGRTASEFFGPRPPQQASPQPATGLTPVFLAGPPVSAPPGGIVRSPGDFRLVLRPGSGFDGPTPQPEARGSGPAADENVIAHWDVIPDQAVSGSLNIGVIAFHSNGIQRVDFSAEGGPWVSARRMAVNSDTGVMEYFANFRADRFSDGAVEIRAVVYPTAGVPVVLEPIKLIANARGALAQHVRYVAPNGSDSNGDGSESKPFATIFQAAASIDAAGGGDADNGVIYLKAGDHNWAGASNRSGAPSTEQTYLTITAAPGLSRDQVRITSSSTSDALNVKFVHLKNLTISRTTIHSASAVDGQLWIDGCVLRGNGPTDETIYTQGSQWTDDIFVTYTTIQDTAHGVGAAVLRNVTARNIGEDAFSGSNLVVNSTVSFQANPSGKTFHPDVFQNVDDVWEGIILYGVTAADHVTAQGVAAGTSQVRDMAIVECNFDNQSPNGSVFQIMEFGGATRNLYIKDSSFVGSANFRTDGRFDFSARNVVIENSTFNGGQFANTHPVAGVVYR